MPDPRAKGAHDLAVEQLHLGELPTERADRLRREVPAQRLAELSESDQEILRAYPPATMTAAIRRRAAQDGQPARRPSRTPWLMAPALAAAAAVLVLALAPRLWGPGEPTPMDPARAGVADTTRIKGLEPYLEVYRLEDAEAQLLSVGAPARSGDRLQLKYVSAGQPYGVVLSLDGNGQLTRHLPSDPAGSSSLAGDGAMALPRSYQLDDAPQYERFIFVTADDPITPAQVEAALASLTPDDLDDQRPHAWPAGWTWSCTTLEKIP